MEYNEIETVIKAMPEGGREEKEEKAAFMMLWSITQSLRRISIESQRISSTSS